MIDLSMADPEHNLRPRLTVMGVGGAGGNAINNMIRCQLEGCDFIAANTDSQALALSLAGRKIQLGINMSRGLGAGSKAEIGRAAAEEQVNDILAVLEGSDMLFVTAGMGGGTGTGAAPVIARAARDAGILTVGVVTKPFHFEGNNRMRQAEAGIAELQQYVDTLIVIPNQNLFRIANERTTFAEAFRLADEVLHCGVRGITDLMVMPGFMNLDFADVKTVMGEMGKAMMGTGEADGDNRAICAAEAAISNPLLDDVSMKGARGVLINITGGLDMTLFEVDQAANRIREEVDPEAQIKVGSTLGENMDGKIRVSVIATGIDAVAAAPRTGTGSSAYAPKQSAKTQAFQQPYRTAAAAGAGQQVVTPSVSAKTNYFTMPQSVTPQQKAAPQQQAAPEIREEEIAEPQEAIVEQEIAERHPQEAARAPRAQEPEPQQAAPRAAAPQQQPQQQPSISARSSQPSSPMTPVEMRMTQLTAAPQQSGASEQRRQRRAESLFTRITGFGLVRPSAQHHEEEDEIHHETHEQEARTPGRQQLDIDPSDRPSLSAEQPEDLLEIPAFLRRQSNH
ncbi:MAG: cell division protein FtsZ [Alphaproteobacteria bacterium]|nr:cell division protein FtsZ [Alphaproteobacteria bacterium]